MIVNHWSSPPRSALHLQRRGVATAFSLIELLVVIMVIGVLAALSGAVFSMAKESAKNSKCQTNLRNIGTALAHYSLDHNGSLLPSYQGSFGYWFNLLEPYVDSQKIDVFHPEVPLPSWIVCPAKRERVGYGWNYFHFGSKDSGGSTNDPYLTASSYAKYSQALHPTGTIIVGDSTDDMEKPYRDSSHFCIYGSRTLLAKRHLGGRANYLFLDGHIEAMTPEQVDGRLPDIFEKYPGQKKDLQQLKGGS